MTQYTNGTSPAPISNNHNDHGQFSTMVNDPTYNWAPITQNPHEYMGTTPPPPTTRDLTFTLADVVTIFRRRRNMILYSASLCTVLGILISLLTPDTYEAVGTLLVTPPALKVSQISAEDPLADLFSGTQQQYKMQTQIMLLESKEIRSKTQKSLQASNISSMPTFTVEAVPDSDVIRISAKGQSAQAVTQSVNALMDTYINEVGDADGRELGKALKFVEQGMIKAQSDLRTTEARLSQFKRAHSISDLEKNLDAEFTTVEQTASEYEALRTQLTTVRARRAEAEARFARETPAEISSLPTDTDQQVQQAEARLTQRIADRDAMLSRYTPDNRKVIIINNEIAALRQQADTVRKTAPRRMTRQNPLYDSLRNELHLLQNEESGLVKAVDEKALRLAAERQKLGSYPGWEQQFAQLQRDLEIARTNYALFSTKREDLRLRQETRRVSSKVMEAASLPTKPVSPNRIATIIEALVLGMFLGVGSALLLEYLDDRVNTLDDLTRTTSLSVLGKIPHVTEEGLRLTHNIRGFTPVAEAYRALRTSVLFASIDNPLRTLMLTSSTPGEGKSTTVANLAASMAADGKRVIVVDADLRHPTQHKLFNVERGIGLTDVMIGKTTLDAALRRPIEEDNLLLLTAGSMAPNPTEMMGSETMAHLIDTLRQHADIVIFDAPPVLAVSDAPLLSSRTDGVLFVVGAGEAKRGGIRQALDTLLRSRARLLGTALNKIDINDVGYGYGYGYAPIESSEADSSLENADRDKALAVPALSNRRNGTSEHNGE